MMTMVAMDNHLIFRNKEEDNNNNDNDNDNDDNDNNKNNDNEDEDNNDDNDGEHSPRHYYLSPLPLQWALVSMVYCRMDKEEWKRRCCSKL